MPTSVPNLSSPSGSARDSEPEQLPFLLSQQQGQAARTLLSYTASLLLPGPDAQLLAVLVAIRAARGGSGNIIGQDLTGLRLNDAHGAVAALRGLGWQIADTVFTTDRTAPPTLVTVPELARESGHPLPFGKQARSRVSGWTTKTLAAKPLKKLPTAARLAGLFLAAHGTSRLLAPIPPDLPEACRAALPSLLEKGFLAELSEGRCRLHPQLRHLSGMRLRGDEEKKQAPHGPAKASRGFRFDAAAWAHWKDAASPALRRHVESIEYCTVCGLVSAYSLKCSARYG
jgi:hypothetical protein